MHLVNLIVDRQIGSVGDTAFEVTWPLAIVIVDFDIRYPRLSFSRTEPSDPLDNRHVGDPIAMSSTDRFQKDTFGELTTEGEQLTSEAMTPDAGRFRYELQVIGNIGAQVAQALLFGLRIVFAIPRATTWSG